MVSYIKPALSILILISVLLSYGMCRISIKCFSCRSDTDPKCSDPFDNSTIPITDCAREKEAQEQAEISQSMCQKIRQKVNGEWQYIRGCAYFGDDGKQGDGKFCLTRTGTNNMFIETCTCDSKDGCNPSSMIIPLPLLLIISVILPVLFKIFV